MKSSVFWASQSDWKWLKAIESDWNRLEKVIEIDWILFKLSAYEMGVSMRLFKPQVLSLFKLPFRFREKIGA